MQNPTGANIVLWGILLMLHSVANDFGSFFALRFLLGIEFILRQGNT